MEGRRIGRSSKWKVAVMRSRRNGTVSLSCRDTGRTSLSCRDTGTTSLS